VSARLRTTQERLVLDVREGCHVTGQIPRVFILLNGWIRLHGVFVLD